MTTTGNVVTCADLMRQSLRLRNQNQQPQANAMTKPRDLLNDIKQRSAVSQSRDEDHVSTIPAISHSWTTRAMTACGYIRQNACHQIADSLIQRICEFYGFYKGSLRSICGYDLLKQQRLLKRIQTQNAERAIARSVVNSSLYKMFIQRRFAAQQSAEWKREEGLSHSINASDLLSQRRKRIAMSRAREQQRPWTKKERGWKSQGTWIECRETVSGRAVWYNTQTSSGLVFDVPPDGARQSQSRTRQALITEQLTSRVQKLNDTRAETEINRKQRMSTVCGFIRQNTDRDVTDPLIRLICKFYGVYGSSLSNISCLDLKTQSKRLKTPHEPKPAVYQRASRRSGLMDMLRRRMNQRRNREGNDDGSSSDDW